MATTLVVNPGSTSRKYALYCEGVLSRVLFFEETGGGFVMNDIKDGVKQQEVAISAHDFQQSIVYALEYLLADDTLVSRHDITHVGVRIVAPGTYFTEHRVVDETYVDALEAIEDIAPLHIPGIVKELRAALQELAHATIMGVSDSAFHTTIPEHVSTVSINAQDAQDYDIKRFGYHGLSFASIARRLPELFGEVPKRTIVCHVGGGVSVAALKDGKSVAESMGYTPVSGMIMSSRGGDITAGVLATLIQKKKLRGARLYDYLYKQSGFQGVAGVRDFRLVLERAAQKDPAAQLALDMFVHQIHSWIGAYVAQLGGLDAIVLTATAPERNPQVRSLLLKDLGVFGIQLDPDKNEDHVGSEGRIEHSDSKVMIGVMKTDEMGEIMRVAESR